MARKPDHLRRLNLSHPLTRNLAAALVVDGGQAFDAGKRRIITSATIEQGTLKNVTYKLLQKVVARPNQAYTVVMNHHVFASGSGVGVRPYLSMWSANGDGITLDQGIQFRRTSITLYPSIQHDTAAGAPVTFTPHSVQLIQTGAKTAYRWSSEKGFIFQCELADGTVYRNTSPSFAGFDAGNYVGLYVNGTTATQSLGSDYVYIWNRFLTDGELWALTKAPYIFFEADVAANRDFFIVPASIGYTLTADQQSYTITGISAGLTAGRTVAATQQSYSLSGQAATLTAGRTVTATQQTYALSGQAATLTAGRLVTATQQTYTLTGIAASLETNAELIADQQTYTLAGQAASLEHGFVVSATQQSYTVSGQAAALEYGRLILAAQQTYTLTGYATGLTLGASVLAAQQTYTLSGQAASFERGFALAADQQTYTLTGYQAGLSIDAQLLASQQTYTLAGQAASLEAGNTLDATQQTYTLSGQAALFAKGVTLDATQQSYTLSGQAATFVYGRAILATQQTYTLAGQAASLERGLILSGDQQTYTLSGIAATFQRGLVLNATQQTYTVTPYDVTLGWSAFLILSVDADDSIYDGQENIEILPWPGTTFKPSGNLVFIKQGSNYVRQTVTSEGTSAIYITASLAGMTLPGAATLHVARPK